MTLRNTNKHFWRRCRGWILSPYLVIAFRNAHKAELHVDCGAYRVPLELPIDSDEAHRSDHMVTVDMSLPTWGETKVGRKQVATTPKVAGNPKASRAKSPQQALF